MTADWERELAETGRFDSVAYAMDRRLESEKRVAKARAESTHGDRAARDMSLSAVDAALRLGCFLQLTSLRWFYRWRWRRFKGTPEQFAAMVRREMTIYAICAVVVVLLGIFVVAFGHP